MPEIQPSASTLPVRGLPCFQLRELGAKIYACGPSMDHFGVKRSQLVYPDITVGEYAVFLEAMSGAAISFMLQ